MLIKTTPLQNEMLKAIAESQYTRVNGAIPESLDSIGCIWADDIILNAQDKGVFTSLMNAGLALHSGRGNDAVIALTVKGFEAYKTLKAESL